MLNAIEPQNIILTEDGIKINTYFLFFFFLSFNGQTGTQFKGLDDMLCAEGPIPGTSWYAALAGLGPSLKLDTASELYQLWP